MFLSNYNAEVNERVVNYLRSEMVTPMKSPVTYPPTPESMNSPGTEESNYNYLNLDHGRNSNDHQMIIAQISSESTLEESLVKLPLEKSHNSKHQPANKKVMTECDSKRRERTSFTNQQLMTMENEFLKHKYLCRPRRIELSRSLGLPENKIKVWFQNRRMKDKKKGLNTEAKKIKNVSCNDTTECEKKDMLMTNQENQQVNTNAVPVPVSYVENHSYSLNNYSSSIGYHQQPQVWDMQNGLNYGMVQNHDHCHFSGNERNFVHNYINYPDYTYDNFQNNYDHYNNYGGYNNIQNETANIVKIEERTHNHNSYGSIPINAYHCSNTNVYPITEFYSNLSQCIS